MCVSTDVLCVSLQMCYVCLYRCDMCVSTDVLCVSLLMFYVCLYRCAMCVSTNVLCVSLLMCVSLQMLCVCMRAESGGLGTPSHHLRYIPLQHCLLPQYPLCPSQQPTSTNCLLEEWEAPDISEASRGRWNTSYVNNNNSNITLEVLPERKCI